MIVAFCLYKYFPFGGLQRDFLRIAQTVAWRGHHVRVYVQSWGGDVPSQFELICVPVTSRTNHGRNAEYHAWVTAHLAKYPADRVVGFNKMPDLDAYYAADVCYAEKAAQEKGFFYRLTARYQHYANFEKATFEQGKAVQLLMLTDKQIGDFQKHYQTESDRFHILPPGIYPDRKYSQQIANSRQIYREKNGIAEDHFWLLQVGSDFSRKGVDRTLAAVAALPEALKNRTQLFVVGQDKPGRFAVQAARAGIKNNVHFFAGRNDVAELMAGADLLVHPAYQEAAGIVLLEAITAGLPVIISAVCGYAHYITRAQCGVVIDEPWSQSAFNDALLRALQKRLLRETWSEQARHFADTEDLYSLPERAADIITGEVNG